MVITQREFYTAMEEINAAYAAMAKRIEELEKKLAEKEDTKKTK